MDPDQDRLLKSADLAALLRSIGETDPLAWEERWRRRGITLHASDLWPVGTSADWLWGLGLPLLSLTERLQLQDDRSLIGLTALPGCGKTTLGRWLEAAAKKLNLSLQVVSIDDFYLPSPDLDQAMSGNPWSVPRALPGSHDLTLMEQSIQRWRQGDCIAFPCFDKALRDGRGDRSGWRGADSHVLIFEGWFVGCEPLADALPITSGSSHLVPPLSQVEIDYRHCVQEELKRYRPIWDELDQLWQIRAPDLNAPRQWKQDQNNSQRRERGVGLPDQELEGFIRMVTAAIPSTSFELPQADVCLSVDAHRRPQQLQVKFKT